MPNFEEISDKYLLELIQELIQITGKEIIDQGHNNTGTLVNSLRGDVEHKNGITSAQMWLKDYYVFIEYPMRPGAVPFTRGSGGAGSALVSGLMRWFASKGVSNKGATFATINTWKKEGRPTRASFRFSNNGRRTGFLSYSVKQFAKTLPEKLRNVYIETTKDYMIRVFKENKEFKIAG